MYKLLHAFLFLSLSTFLSCKSEEEIEKKEALDISYSVTKLEAIGERNVSVDVYPNPFANHVSINIYNPGSLKVEVNITDEKGRFRRISNESLSHGSLLVNFEKAEAGVYLCEVLIGDKLERISLFKTEH